MCRFTQDFRVRRRDKKRKKNWQYWTLTVSMSHPQLDSEHKCTVNTVRDTESSALSRVTHTHKYGTAKPC